MSFKIGNIQIDNPVVVAPMAGISNSAFRVTVKEFGAGLVVCEMISDKGIQFRNEKTLSMLHIEPNEYPLSVQIMGGNKDTLVEAAKYVAENTEAAIIDINMGCPVNKVIKAEAGAKWLLDPNKVYEMVAAVVDAVDKPVTGASAVAMHGRTRVQMYDGKANWEVLGEVKKNLTRIPLIGNGDVRSPQDAKKMIEIAGVDGVMIGRAALANPWMIKQTVHYLETGELLPENTVPEKIEIAKTHLDRLANLKGESVATKEFRKLAAYYLKGIPRATKTKVAINESTTVSQVNEILDQFVQEHLERVERQLERGKEVE